MVTLCGTVLIAWATIRWSANIDSAATRGLQWPTAMSGCLDLSGWDFDTNGVASLDGEWEFHWKQLIEPSSFAAASDGKMRESAAGADAIDCFASLPAPWNRIKLEDNQGLLPSDGYATYRLRITVADGRERVGILIPYASTAYKMWANGALIAENGTVGASRAESSPQYLPTVAQLFADDGVIDLVMQVSNFHHRRGGAWQRMYIGTVQDVVRMRESALARSMFIFGCILATAVMYIWTYAFNREDKAALYFGLFSLLMAIRALLGRDVALTSFAPGFNWEVQLKMEYWTMCLAVTFSGMFVENLYGADTWRPLVVAIETIGVGFSMLVAVTPARVYSRALAGFQATLIAATVYLVYVVVLAAVRKRERAAYLLAVAPLILAVVIHDVWCYRAGGSAGELSPIGMAGLALAEVMAQVMRYRSAKDLAVKDPLTGAFNRNRLREELSNQLALAEKRGQRLSVIFMDVDDFKGYNDSCGHLEGDRALTAVANSLAAGVRQSDTVVRFGGDEFVILLPLATKEEATGLAARLRFSAESGALSGTGVTLSVGVATFPDDASDADGLLGFADARLYREKARRPAIERRPDTST